jgi:hypothetical protein
MRIRQETTEIYPRPKPGARALEKFEDNDDVRSFDLNTDVPKAVLEKWDSDLSDYKEYAGGEDWIWNDFLSLAKRSVNRGGLPPRWIASPPQAG